MSSPPVLSDVLLGVRDSIATVTLNRPEQRNSLSASMMRDLGSAFRWCKAEPSVAVVVLTGAGDRAFCAGADLAGFGDEQPALELNLHGRRALADIFIELQAARLLVYKAATRLDKGEDAREDAYVCKYFADEMAFRAADQCMQIHGGIGLTTDLPIEKLWRQQRSYRITEGASEVMKMVIARHVLKVYG